MSTVGLLNPETTALLVVDYQQALMPHIFGHTEMAANANKMIRGAAILGVAIVVTEQYPKGLGHTSTEIELPDGQEIIEKITFSCMLTEPVVERLNRLNVRSLIIIGIEAHICVLKTALDAALSGYEVHVVADAISSRTEENKKAALQRMKQSGVYITSTEMTLFQLMDEAGSDVFKEVSRLIR